MTISLAKRLTGMDERAFYSADLPNVRSAKGVFYPKGVSVRQNIRAYMGLIVGPEDLNSKRRELLKNIPAALKNK
jgi:hypothetical protein